MKQQIWNDPLLWFSLFLFKLKIDYLAYLFKLPSNEGRRKWKRLLSMKYNREVKINQKIRMVEIGIYPIFFLAMQ